MKKIIGKYKQTIDGEEFSKLPFPFENHKFKIWLYENNKNTVEITRCEIGSGNQDFNFITEEILEIVGMEKKLRKQVKPLLKEQLEKEDKPIISWEVIKGRNLKNKLKEIKKIQSKTKKQAIENAIKFMIGEKKE